jgi:hypothetical protein
MAKKRKIIRKRKAKKRVKESLKPVIAPKLKAKEENEPTEIDGGVGFDAGLGRDAWLINQSRKRGKK